MKTSSHRFAEHVEQVRRMFAIKVIRNVNVNLQTVSIVDSVLSFPYFCFHFPVNIFAFTSLTMSVELSASILHSFFHTNHSIHCTFPMISVGCASVGGYV